MSVLGLNDMKLIVGITPEEDDRIASLVTRGRYKTQEQFIQVSIRNQLSLEEGDASVAHATQVKNAPRPPEHAHVLAPSVLPAGLEAVPDFKPSGSLGAPQITTNEVLPHFATKLWPCKLVVRFLANYMAHSGETAPQHTDLLTPLQNVAVETKQFLEAAHRSNPRMRGTFLHAGLPDQDAKSIKRFHDLYFIGRPGSRAPSQSLAVRLGLIAIDTDAAGRSTVRLTKQGLKFAGMDNPVLDSPDPDSVVSPFSDEEAAFLVGVLQDCSSHDATMMRALAKALTAQPESRDDALERMRSIIERAGGKTEAILNGMFVAITSRLVELGVAEIRKDGVRTQYIAGPRAKLLAGGA